VHFAFVRFCTSGVQRVDLRALRPMMCPGRGGIDFARRGLFRRALDVIEPDARLLQVFLSAPGGALRLREEGRIVLVGIPTTYAVGSSAEIHTGAFSVPSRSPCVVRRKYADYFLRPKYDRLLLALLGRLLFSVKAGEHARRTAYRPFALPRSPRRWLPRGFPRRHVIARDATQRCACASW